MTSISEEIQQLQLRIVELEKQKKEKDETDKKTSIDHNFSVINDFLQEIKPGLESVSRSRGGRNAEKYVYTRSSGNRYIYPESATHIGDLVMHLEAVYNILKIVDERLQKLEQNGI
jgi:hypothetical protein